MLFPRLPHEATLDNIKCPHRFFPNQTICAIRCDGRDDLCKDFEDEKGCETISLKWQVLLAVIVVICIIFLLKVAHVLRKKVIDLSDYLLAIESDKCKQQKSHEDFYFRP